MTKERLDKIKRVLSQRRLDLTVVFENIHDPHNVSAILRTCDAVGVSEVHLLYTNEVMPKLGKKSSASALKWLEIRKWKNHKDCFAYLKKQKFTILGTSLEKPSKGLYETDLTGKVAIVMGNEHRGIGEETKKYCDSFLFIPMSGMIQSLNVSVAAAVILYEASRQKKRSATPKKGLLTPSQYKLMRNQWLVK